MRVLALVDTHFRAKCGNGFLKDVDWFERRTVQVDERRWAVQPIGPLCDKCGQAVSSFADADPEEIIASAKVDRVKRAELMLGHVHSCKKK